MVESRTAGPERIVVGVDGSAHSADALRWALRQAVRTGAKVEAITCWEAPIGMVGPNKDAESLMNKTTRQTGEELVAVAVSETEGANGVTVGTREVQGHPASALIEAATGADLLVVGSRGHGAFTGMLLGSVGLHCATHSPCPVVIVH